MDKKIIDYLNNKNWQGSIDLYKKLCDKFKQDGKEFKLDKYSTLQLRDLAKNVGYDYWNNLQNSNTIDGLDSALTFIKN